MGNTRSPKKDFKCFGVESKRKGSSNETVSGMGPGSCHDTSHSATCVDSGTGSYMFHLNLDKMGHHNTLSPKDGSGPYPVTGHLPQTGDGEDLFLKMVVDWCLVKWLGCWRG